MSWHEEVLDARARKAAERLAAAAGEFYLAGGTGLALRLGHRISLDLDFFSSENPLGPPQRADLLRALDRTGEVEVRENKDGTCHLVLEGTRISFLRYPYSLLKPVSRWRGLAVASVEDIAAMKISAIAGRGARKDFIDLYWIARRSGLEAPLRWAERKYPGHRDFILHAARALVYFEDAEKEPAPRLLKSLPWEKVKAYFRREVPGCVRRVLGD